MSPPATTSASPIPTTHAASVTAAALFAQIHWVLSSFEHLERQGFIPISNRNTWKLPDYRGVNSTWAIPGPDSKASHKFEVQFHTPESFEVQLEMRFVARSTSGQRFRAHSSVTPEIPRVVWMSCSAVAASIGLRLGTSFGPPIWRSLMSWVATHSLSRPKTSSIKRSGLEICRYTRTSDPEAGPWRRTHYLANRW